MTPRRWCTVDSRGLGSEECNSINIANLLISLFSDQISGKLTEIGVELDHILRFSEQCAS